MQLIDITVRFSETIRGVAIATLLAGAFVYSPAFAEPPATTAAPTTPSLVLPAEEASKEIAPKTNTAITEIPVPEEDNQSHGSLSGKFLSSYVAHSQGDVTSAIRFLKESIAKDPNNQDLVGQLLILELMHGEMPEAIAVASNLSKEKDHELIVDLLLAVESVKNHDLNQASAYLSKAKSSSFDHIWLPLLLGWMESDPKKFTEVKPEDLVGEGETPTFILYHTALLNDFRGYHKVAKGQYQAAIKDLSRAPFRALLAYVQINAKDNDRETLQQLLVDLDQQRPDMAELLRREVPFLQHMTDTIVLPHKPFIRSTQEGVAEVLLTMASMLYTLDISQDIPLYLQLALYLKQDFPTAQLMLGNYYETMELWEEASKQYEHIRPDSPLFLKAGLRRAYIFEEQGKPEKADELLSDFMAQFPDSIEVLTSRGDLLRNRGNFAEAIQYYDKAITVLPRPDAEEAWMLYFARGACYERIKQLAAAERDLKRSLELSPKQAEVLNYLGYMWLEADMHVEEAVDMIKEAYTLAPDQPHIVDSMGWAFLKTGKVEEAIALFENAAETVPNDPTINEHLGDAYWIAGRELEARYQWKRALDFAEENTDTALIQQKIKDGMNTYGFTIMPSPKEPATSGSSGMEVAKPNDETPVSGAPVSTPTP